MSKSATEQFQIKKKRKHPLNGTSVVISSTASPVNQDIEITNNNNNRLLPIFTRYVNGITSDAIIKENFPEFQIDDKFLNHSSLYFKPITAADETADIYLDSDCIAAVAASDKAHAVATPPQNNLNNNNNSSSIRAAPTAAVSLSTNCLRDSVQAQSLLRGKSFRSNTANNTMPLQHGFYAKGASASKRALKSAKVQSNSPSGLNKQPTTGDAAKRPRHSLGYNSAIEDNLKIRSQSLMAGPNGDKLQFSYLVGESLARHGRLQEAFDIYALIASEQPKGFIPLEKLNILATALLEYIRMLSSSSKKPVENTEKMTKPLDDMQQLTNISTTTSSASGSSNLATQWQLMAGAFNPHLAHSNSISDTPTLIPNGNLDLHNPSRELARNKTPTLLDDLDPLLCPLCRDILRCPVTANCGHTFCRQCCDTITMCNICHIKFPRLHKEEPITETLNLVSLSTATSTTTSSSSRTMSSSLTPSVQNFSGSQAQSNVSFSATGGVSYSSESPFGSMSTDDMPRLRMVTSPMPPTLAGSPTTVTTTTVACTTDTATTTMAATSSSTLSTGSRGGSSSSDSMKFMPDVLVRRLVEKWWGPDLQARKILETATSYMHLNLLDDALKFCNVSLEKAPSNFKSLLLRAEVLRKMNHYQSSLADVDNALKSRYTSAKAHYLRSLALSDLGRYEEALYEICLAINLDKSSNLSSTELFQHDLTKILQKLLSQTPKCIKMDLVNLSTLRSKCPYDLPAREYRIKRRNINAQDEDTLQAAYEDDDFLSANYGKECDILMTDDEVLLCRDFLNCADKRNTYASIARKYEMELKRQTSRKHVRRKWAPKETELLPIVDVESARCSGQFRNVLERLQQEFVRLKKIESSPEYAMKQLISVAPTLIDASDFDCVLCCRTFWKPVVTPCGHTYCLVCLDRCMDYTSSCPLCMAPLVEPSVNMVQGASSPVPLILTKRPVTKFLEAAMKRFIPDSYQKRFRQEMVMEPSVPIFICTTAFPYVPCPLFVYEPRYRLMVRRAIDSGDKQFGIVQPHSGKARYHDYGCMLDIRDCLLLGDGCSILSTMGCKRFKILARNEKDGYETAKVEYIHDEAIPDEHLGYVTSMHSIVLGKAIAWYESLGQDLKHEILQSYGEMPMVEENWSSREDGPAWAWWIIALLPLRPQLKVDILATTSLEKRLRAIEKTINSMPGNYHYQRVSQNCNVAVVVHSGQQHHSNLNSPHRDNDDDLENDDEEDIDMDNEHVIMGDDDVNEDNRHEEDVDVEPEETTLQHHIQNIDDNDENINSNDLMNNDHQNEQQDHSQRHHRQRHHHHHHHHHHHQLHQNSLQLPEHFENVDNVDECCQRTTTTTSLVQHVLSSNDQSQDHHHHHHHHTTGNTEHHHHTYENHRRHAAHSLLL
ncbi:uncharacterized protein LOC133326678 [Musca vetustissima]|uniref:uncharacterized protein LOC133326678 n=1 Tax=Musca vetustissima TaxID=27455 RepID=UPI002AB75A29|nr:uncharacterized protein LOC133326678 [Musca vetustissima]